MGMTSGLIRVTADQLKGILSGDISLDDYLFPEDDEAEGVCDLYKAWNGISFLLEKIGGDGSAVGRAVLGGEAFGEDMGYGPPMYLSVDEVKEIASELKAIDLKAFRAAFDATEMHSAGIYSFNIDRADEDLEFFGDHYKEMLAFYEDAAANKQAVIQYLV